MIPDRLNLMHEVCNVADGRLVIMATLHGSHLYGTATENSDIDVKGVYIPTPEEMLLGKAKKTLQLKKDNPNRKNLPGELDITLYSLAEFINMACDGEMIAIDMLYADTNPSAMLLTGDVWEYIMKFRHGFISKDMKAFTSYAKKQVAKYGAKGSRMDVLRQIISIVEIQPVHWKLETIKGILPETEHSFWKKNQDNGNEFYYVLGSHYQSTIRIDEFYKLMYKKWEAHGERARQAMNNKGIDWKAVSHAMRACFQLLELYQQGRITFPLARAANLLGVKSGNGDWESHISPWLDSLIKEVEQAALASSYPDEVDRKFWDDMVFNIYLAGIGV